LTPDPVKYFGLKAFTHIFKAAKWGIPKIAMFIQKIMMK
jgi:hypothetical protein